MNIVITMAGNSSRFFSAGYTIPKFMVSVFKKTIFEWSLLTLKNIISPEDKIIFVANNSYEVNNFIYEKCNNMMLSNIEVIKIDKVTDGQATTALIALNKISDHNEPMLIYNIDTLVSPKFLLRNEISSAGWIPYFETEGDHWSFVKENDEGYITEIEEKVRISNKATIGLYYFETAEYYFNSYKHTYIDNVSVYKEKYIAPLYKYLIKNNISVRGKLIPSSGIFPLGTPEEVERFKKINLRLINII